MGILNEDIQKGGGGIPTVLGVQLGEFEVILVGPIPLTDHFESEIHLAHGCMFSEIKNGKVQVCMNLASAT